MIVVDRGFRDCVNAMEELVHFRRIFFSPTTKFADSNFADDEVRRFQYRRMNLSPKPCLSQI